MENLKIGDRVLLSEYAWGWGACKEDANNKEVVITNIEPDRGEYTKIYFKNAEGKEISTIKREIIRIISSTEEWIPKVGEYAAMEKAGGFGFSWDNNGCVALITEVGTSFQYGKTYPAIKGKLVNPKVFTYAQFNHIPIRGRENHEIICRKALSHEIPQKEIEFKVWDWVVFKNNRFSHQAGEIAQITEINERKIQTDKVKKNCGYIQPEWVRPTLPSEIPIRKGEQKYGDGRDQYKIGGWARMTTNYASSFKGDYVQITSLSRLEHHIVDAVTKNGEKVGNGLNTETYPNARIRECEWVGMQCPNIISTMESINNEPTIDLIAEAKRRFPIGTIINGIEGPNGRTGHMEIRTDNFKFYHTGERISYNGLPGYVYEKGKWAEIIKKIDIEPVIKAVPYCKEPIKHLLEEAKIRFPIGSWFQNTANKQEGIYEVKGWGEFHSGSIQNLGGPGLLYTKEWG